MRIDEIISLSSKAEKALSERIHNNVMEKGVHITEIVPRSHYVEWHFTDKSFIDMSVIRDFNDDMNPTHIVLSEYVVQFQDGVKRYNRQYIETFKVSKKK